MLFLLKRIFCLFKAFWEGETWAYNMYKTQAAAISTAGPLQAEFGSGSPISGSHGSKCNICGRVLTSKQGFLYHMKQHAGDFNYYCELCNQGFMWKAHYEGHMNRHRNVAPFQCKFCEKRFTFKCAAVRHMRECKLQNELAHT